MPTNEGARTTRLRDWGARYCTGMVALAWYCTGMVASDSFAAAAADDDDDCCDVGVTNAAPPDADNVSTAISIASPFCFEQLNASAAVAPPPPSSPPSADAADADNDVACISIASKRFSSPKHASSS